MLKLLGCLLLAIFLPTAVLAKSIPVEEGLTVDQSGAFLQGERQIVITFSGEFTADLQLQTVKQPIGTIHLGRVQGRDRIEYRWNTQNTPNGEYRLYGTIYGVSGSQVIVGPSQVIVRNNGQVGSEDLIFPDRFDPKIIPTDPVAKITQVEKVNTFGQPNGLFITGEGLPHTIVSLLVFSNNPIMVTTSTDANGRYSYNLEKPLETGKHEVYAVFPKSDGSKIRSDPTEFSIAKTYAAAAEGQGLLLAKVTELNPFWKIILTALGLSSAGALSVFLIYHRKIFIEQPERTI